MDLTDKFIQLELSDTALNHLLGSDPEKAAVVPRWKLLGEVTGETPGIGIWFRVSGLETDTETISSIDLTSDTGRPVDCRNCSWMALLSACGGTCSSSGCSSGSSTRSGGSRRCGAGDGCAIGYQGRGATVGG